ncbi:MAG TPA: 2-aminoethylphosphonate--pyruvate transaminase [Verrucomicrobiae bacterium]|nr:2-aminoethylphosphonate--pyruvate transaminase [Verrucomicrobiae bacterium]
MHSPSNHRSELGWSQDSAAQVSGARDKLLFTPGPLTTSLAVKQAMLHDAGSWDVEFNRLVASIRERLLSIAGLDPVEGWEAILLQGSGTYGVEAVFQTAVPRTGKVAVLSNGAYGNRMAQILSRASIDHVLLATPEDQPVGSEPLRALLGSDPAITHVAMVHCETTTGILNPIESIGEVTRAAGKQFIVDAMSSFGAVPIDFQRCGIDFLISSPNKCLEGVPGFCFVFCRRALLEACDGNARSLSLDLLDQLRGFDRNGQFRYTPPTHSVLAFDQALREFAAEGGVRARGERYRANHKVLCSGMAQLGLRAFLDPSVQSFIITAFHFPAHSGFDFGKFYAQLSERGFLIYPGKLTRVDTFRIGTIGRIFPADLQQLVYAIGAILPA